ncbi:MAG: hypothetical protein IJO04_05480 [Oscillospiraceae bacterium]|nr:hypothetical protein [Oscillospiraceae bacterium]
MKKFINKKFIVVTALALLLFVTVGSTLAYIFASTDPVENIFNPSNVSCAVVENNADDENTGKIIHTGNTKNNVQIKNTGDTDAYIRVAVVVNWMSAVGTRVWATKPVECTCDGEHQITNTVCEYSITYVTGPDWVDGGDGYYYYTRPVAPGEMTDILITNATQLVAKGPVGTDNTQYYLSIEIVASAIQSSGMGANSAQEAWAKAQQQNG